jgi:hypothetical protein
MTTYRLTPRVAALTTLIVQRWGPGSTEARQIHALGDALPRALREMALECPDGYPTSTPGASDRGGSASTGSADKLGNLVHRRERAVTAYSTLCASVAAVAVGVAQEDRTTVRRALEACIGVTDGWHPKIDTKPIVKAQRCSVPAERALEPWVRPECENVASPGRHGMCDACSMRSHRWVKAHQEEVA